MGVVEVIVALGSISGLGLFVAKKMQKTPAERRRAALVDLEKALNKAKTEHTVEDLSNWIGKRL